MEDLQIDFESVTLLFGSVEVETERLMTWLALLHLSGVKYLLVNLWEPMLGTYADIPLSEESLEALRESLFGMENLGFPIRLYCKLFLWLSISYSQELLPMEWYLNRSVGIMLLRSLTFGLNSDIYFWSVDLYTRAWEVFLNLVYSHWFVLLSKHNHNWSRNLWRKIMAYSMLRNFRILWLVLSLLCLGISNMLW